MRRSVLALVLLLVAGCSAGGESPIGTGVPTPPPTPGIATTAPAPAATPEIRVQEVATGLEHPWDIGFLPDGSALVTERPGRITMLSSTDPGATVTGVEADLTDVYVEGEGGLMGLVVHPDFAQSRRFTTCQTHQRGGEPVDVRLVTWELSRDGIAATRVADPLVGGLPINPSGRHSGCRPEIGPDGALYVGTGDTARGDIAQELTSLGGKVLRVDLDTGAPAPGNPFLAAPDPATRLIYTYGHRNVQGLAVQPGTDRIFAAEHGPDESDEINLLRPGRNYGWDPSQGGTVSDYDESVPMTDLQRFPNAVPAVWDSGESTEAICGAAFLDGEQWGSMDGLLAVAALAGQELLLMRVEQDATITEVGQLPELDGAYGRLRAARLGPDGALYVTTSNGDDDKVLRIAPG
ncbi:MAG: PQQ-dependent sugar dehydrogenase [Pseudonocardiaceae bacterium]|nr:PQQ-dependent sugar dehydrogenase [Pseudonocardiaceae bacterium]